MASSIPSSQQLPHTFFLGGFVVELTPPREQLYEHPRVQMSSTYYQYSTTSTSLSFSDPQPCSVQQGLDLPLLGEGGLFPRCWDMSYSYVLWSSIYFLLLANPSLLHSPAIVNSLSMFKLLCGLSPDWTQSDTVLSINLTLTHFLELQSTNFQLFFFLQDYKLLAAKEHFSYFSVSIWHCVT